MAMSDAKKRFKMMAKEWWKSKSKTKSLSEVVDMGVLHNHELAG
jgi:hypothetical protein